jgi:hypothetical protein
LEEEKATLEGMVKSYDEMLMEIASETVLDLMVEDDKDKEEEEDTNDREDAIAPLLLCHHLLCPQLRHLRRLMMKALWR